MLVAGWALIYPQLLIEIPCIVLNWPTKPPKEESPLEYVLYEYLRANVVLGGPINMPNSPPILPEPLREPVFAQYCAASNCPPEPPFLVYDPAIPPIELEVPSDDIFTSEYK